MRMARVVVGGGAEGHIDDLGLVDRSIGVSPHRRRCVAFSREGGLVFESRLVEHGPRTSTPIIHHPPSIDAARSRDDANARARHGIERCSPRSQFDIREQKIRAMTWWCCARARAKAASEDEEDASAETRDAETLDALSDGAMARKTMFEANDGSRARARARQSVDSAMSEARERAEAERRAKDESANEGMFIKRMSFAAPKNARWSFNVRLDSVTEDVDAEESRASMESWVGEAKRTKPTERDVRVIAQALSQTFIFAQLDGKSRDSVARGMFLIDVADGSVLMEEGALGDKLYLVASGTFDVYQSRMGADIKVAERTQGDVLGELALLYRTPRNATVKSVGASQVWVCPQNVFKLTMRHQVTETVLVKNVFLEQVAAFSKLSIGDRTSLVQHLNTRSFAAGEIVIREGESTRDGLFYLITSGSVVVSKSDPNTGEERVVNHLFRYDFFGEAELLKSADVWSHTVRASEGAPIVCYVLERGELLKMLAPVHDELIDAKSPERTRRRMSEIKGGKTWRTANIQLRESARAGGAKENITAIGRSNPLTFPTSANTLVTNIELVEKELLGGGSGGCVNRVVLRGPGHQSFALKRVRKIAVKGTPSHIFCEKEVTREINHFALMCQHANFQDTHHLYMLFDYMDGCDLMDVLANYVQIKSIPTMVDGQVKSVSTLVGISENMTRYFVAMLVLAFEYLHENGIIYRDLKPENVLVGLNGKCKLGDFGFAKKLSVGEKAFTFCGTPGYVAPEIVLSKGYGLAIDWWALGVLTFIAISGVQPFNAGESTDPLSVMRRIVDASFEVCYPTYATNEVCDFISKLLQRDSKIRLGNMHGGVRQVKNHPWFTGFDWKLLERGKYQPSPIAIQPEFLQLRRERLRGIEHETLLATQIDLARSPDDVALVRAIELFKEF